MFNWQDADDKTAAADRIKPKAEFDTSSGDSCWVRQYLDWCDSAIAIPAEAGIGFVPARAHRFHAT